MKGYGWSLHLEYPPKTTQGILALAQHYGGDETFKHVHEGEADMHRVALQLSSSFLVLSLPGFEVNGSLAVRPKAMSQPTTD